MSRSLLVLTCLAVLAACVPSGATEVEDERLQINLLRERIADVGERRATADELLAATVASVREVDAIVSGLRQADSVDAARGTWEGVDRAFKRAKPGELRPALVELALAVDRARGTLHRARPELTSEWQKRYLDAEDAVLVAIREYAEASDEFGQTVVRHYDTYRDLHERTAIFVEQRWYYRTSEEAADAYELAVQPVLADLATAQADIAEARRPRDDAARAVNEAVEAADEVWRSRPTEAPVDDG